MRDLHCSLVTIAIASAVATGCSPTVTTRPARSVPVAMIAASATRAVIAPPLVEQRSIALPDHEPAPGADSGTLIFVQAAHDPQRLAARAPVSATVERTLTHAGFRARAAEPDPVATPGMFVVTPTVHELTIDTTGSSTTITCRITLRVAPWTGVERWEANTTASASGEAQATTSNARAQIELGIADCFEGAVRAAAARQVIPFLKKTARTPH